MIGQLILQVILIALNAVFACAEIAVISINDNKLEKMAMQGDKRAKRLMNLTSQPARFLATIQVAITLSGFLGSAFAADNFSDVLVKWLVGLGVGISVDTLDKIAVVVITLVLSYITLVFGELVPKRVAMKKAESLALRMSALISFFSKIFAPIVWLLTVSTNGILRLIGIDPNAESENDSEEEIRMMADVGSQKGQIDIEEKEMIHNVFEFDDLTADEFATHRTDVSLLWLDEDAQAWEKTMHESRHTIYPVCDEMIDKVIGVLNVKDYFALTDKSRKSVMENAIKVPLFIPEGVRADILFKRMKNLHNHFAVLVDEYGSVTGIVTMHDILEQLVGDLGDDDADSSDWAQLEQLDSNTWNISGSVPLDTVCEKLKVALPIDEYDTFGGYVLSAYGVIPEDGSRFELDLPPLHIKVTEIVDHRLKKATVCVDKAAQ